MTSGVQGRLESATGGIACASAAIFATIVLAPLTFRMASGISGPRRVTLIVLLLETTYLLLTFACLGTLAPRRAMAALRRAPLIPALPVVTLLLAGALAGAHPSSLAAAQPGAIGTAVLGWGAGRAARAMTPRSVAAGGLATLFAIVLGASLVPISHVTTYLEAWPWASEVLLGANPYVAVTHDAGFDLIRTRELYERLPLSSHRFQYPRRGNAPLVLIVLGLGLAALRIRLPFPPRRRRELLAHASKEIA